MSFETKGKHVIEEVPYGTYIWRMNDGTYLVDDEYRHLSIFCMKNDQRAINALAQEARSLGFPNGTAEWKTGTRKITDDEFEEQEARQRMGLVADPLDYGAIADSIKASRND